MPAARFPLNSQSDALGLASDSSGSRQVPLWEAARPASPPWAAEPHLDVGWGPGVCTGEHPEDWADSEPHGGPGALRMGKTYMAWELFKTHAADVTGYLSNNYMQWVKLCFHLTFQRCLCVDYRLGPRNETGNVRQGSCPWKVEVRKMGDKQEKFILGCIYKGSKQGQQVNFLDSAV